MKKALVNLCMLFVLVSIAKTKLQAAAKMPTKQRSVKKSGFISDFCATAWSFRPLHPSIQSTSELVDLIIHQIFSLTHDWSKHVTWANIPQLKLGNIRGYNPSNIFARARLV